MDKINKYLDTYFPKIRKMGESGLYEVYSIANPSIAIIGKAGVTLLKDELLLRGLKLTPEKEIDERSTSNIKS